MSRKPNNHTGLKVFLILLILLMIAATGYLIHLCLQLAQVEVTLPSQGEPIQLPTAAPTETTEVPTETTEPEPVPEHVVSTATVGAMGDLLMHTPIFLPQYNPVCYDKATGEYNFDSLFKHLTEYTSALDYAAVNLETTLCGTSREYSGYPYFNCPDTIVDGAMNAGFDMMLTANNHSYDTGIDGYKRTVEVVREKGMETLGTMASPEDPKYSIQEINGIKIGMLCYTYAYSVTADGRPSLNGNPHISEAGICNYFHSEHLPAFYAEVETYLAEMEEAGAEAFMMYIHWGVEYQTHSNATQQAMAQKLCDLGIDVIVGGHPHVVQPMDLLESTVDPDHRTVCIYSVGNAVSNQRTGGSELFPKGYTEDGVMFSVTFEKYSDGTVYLAGADVLPTWVNKFHNSSNRLEYNIMPLDYDRVAEWQELYDLSDTTYGAMKKSYDRTMGIVGEGLTESQEYLTQAKEAREQYYYDLAFFPEKFATEATEAETTVPETTEAA